MISRKAIADAFEVITQDSTVRIVVVYCNRNTEAVRVHRHEGGLGIHKGTYLVTMGSLFPEEKAFLTRHKTKYGQSALLPKVWIRYA
jgi:hypothetical protein